MAYYYYTDELLMTLSTYTYTAMQLVNLILVRCPILADFRILQSTLGY